MVGTLMGKMTSGLTRTRDSLLGGIQRLMKSRGTIDEELLREVEHALIAADIGTGATAQLIQNIKRRVAEERYVSTEEFTALLKDEVARLLLANGPEPDDGEQVGIPNSPRPYVIMLVGVNGSGKTTTIGKLAHRFVSAGLKVLVGAADTFRAAANEQLELWARRAGVDIVQQQKGADPASVAFDTVQSARARGYDVVLIDSAGRLHTNTNLMEELAKIRRVVDKVMPGAPHEVLLVLDAGTGQNGLQQAKLFSKAVGVTGVVLTKLDGTAKGGIVLAVGTELGIPVKYVGVGENAEDLQPFHPRVFVDALFAPT
ncbi:MAG: signal recognition particle-docking protein FtsY [Ignavibacteriales bacterium]|nr:signal recognition particle-docking protein FtsY [Ignavibacteriales bacterium]